MPHQYYNIIDKCSIQIVNQVESMWFLCRYHITYSDSVHMVAIWNPHRNVYWSHAVSVQIPCNTYRWYTYYIHIACPYVFHIDCHMDCIWYPYTMLLGSLPVDSFITVHEVFIINTIIRYRSFIYFFKYWVIKPGLLAVTCLFSLSIIDR